MKQELILDDFQATLSDLIDKERYEVIATERKDVWVIKKVEKES